MRVSQALLLEDLEKESRGLRNAVSDLARNDLIPKTIFGGSCKMAKDKCTDLFTMLVGQSGISERRIVRGAAGLIQSAVLANP